ncbi:Zn-ribbon domain-containing OB-fold protein [Glaciimonas sp. GNP009]
MSESTMFTGAGPEKVYYDALKAGTFQIQRCGACTKHVFYPRVICSHCGSPNLAWVTPNGNGTVYSTTIVRRKADAGGDLNIALIDLEEGVRMMSRVDGIPFDQISIGMAVKASIVTENAQTMIIFTPAGDAQ